MLDLLVIGAGLTGLTAALTAAQSGLSVRVISKGLGALHWVAGTVDVMGYLPDGEPVSQPFDAIGALPAAHPYSLVGVERIQESFDWFQKLVEEAGLTYVASDSGANFLLPSPAGAKRPTLLAPVAQYKGDLADSSPLVIVGFDGMRDFYPDLIATNLQKQGVQARAVHLPISDITDRSDYNTVHLAKALDDPMTRKTLGQQLSNVAISGERIGLPAILGYAEHPTVLRDLVDAARTEIFEIPTLPPSIPGIRLHRLLARQLDELGVRIETGMEVISFYAEDGRLQWVETETSARPLRHRAANIFVATGGVLGGGLVGDVEGQLREVVFDLPLNAPQNRDEWFRSEFMDPRGQPVFQAGVQVNHTFQPINPAGDIVYNNLWSAGSMLANCDPIRERSLEGVGIATGRAAAQSMVASTNGHV